MENQNLFAKAIDNNELLNFALGNGEFYLRTPDYDEHWVLGSWISYILPYCKSNECEHSIKSMISLLIEDNVLKMNEKIEKLLYHVYVFYCFRSEGRIKTVDIIMGLELKIIHLVEAYRKELIVVKNDEKLNELKYTILFIKKRGGLASYNINE